jgi:DNA invertase Pin-like site-specific DNA recombinase
MEKQKERVIFYNRVSSSLRQQDSSYEVQKENCLRLLEEHSHEWEPATTKNDSVFGDRESGTKLKERVQFREMLRLCGIDVNVVNGNYYISDLGYPSIATLLVVKSTSRFSRDVGTGIQILDYLFKKGVKVKFLNTGKTVSSHDLVTDIQLSVDNNFSNSLSQNQKQSYRKNVEYRQSIYNCTFLFGYDYIWENNRRVLKKKEGYTDIVKHDIFENYLNGLGCRRISSLLSEKGIIGTRGKLLSESGVMSILRNVKYAGYLQIPHENPHNGIGIMKRSKDNYGIIPCDFIEPMIDLDLFNKVQKMINSKPKIGNKGVVQTKDKYSKILMCSDCLCHFTRQIYRPVKNQPKSHYYLCSRQQHRGVKLELEGCDNHIIQEYFLDEYFEKLANGSWKEEQLNYKKSLISKLEKLRFGTIETITEDNITKLKDYEDTLKKLLAEQEDFIDNRFSFKAEVIARKVNSIEEKIQITQKEIDKITVILNDGITQINYIETALRNIKNVFLPDAITKEDVIYNTYVCMVTRDKVTKENPTKKNSVILEPQSNFQFQIAEFESEVLDKLSFYPDSYLWQTEEDYTTEQKELLEKSLQALKNKA